ncbi:hypothetical protein [Nocardioides coralli]|uniref:hypothetical protein n=1 Tax=Nocardioides coralli TaxID=2872154 RepID=UPI001CA3AA91|nr:hypothetical protein [Nocardioides coralli]QZY28549.1 hypothetical protein K6T13_13925 [Nocardioides coralli]
MRRLLTTVLAASLTVLAACSGEAADEVGHTHAGGAIVSLPVGDGTEVEEVGYRLARVSLPEQAGMTGEVSFQVETFRGEPLTSYIEELTKDLHLYVVREDLAVFRHLHPEMDDDGTWRAPVSLPATGDYRVIAEFVARDEGGNGDHVILGETVAVDRGPAGDEWPSDPVIDVEVTQPPTAGPDGRMGLTIRDARGRPVDPGTYLGSYGHVTGFHRDSGSMLHVHPLSAPDVTEDGALLTFHTEIEDAGAYRLFVQVRVDGYLHTVPVEVDVTDRA